MEREHPNNQTNNQPAESTVCDSDVITSSEVAESLSGLAALLETAAAAEGKSIHFQRIPEGIYSGMPYVSAIELIEAKITRYSPNQVYRLLERNLITGFKIGRCVILSPLGVEQLLARENASLEGRLRSQGLKPGSKLGNHRQVN